MCGCVWVKLDVHVTTHILNDADQRALLHEVFETDARSPPPSQQEQALRDYIDMFLKARAREMSKRERETEREKEREREREREREKEREKGRERKKEREKERVYVHVRDRKRGIKR